MSKKLEDAQARIGSAQKLLMETYEELAELAETLEDPMERGAVNGLLWKCAAGQISRDRYFSQFGQDAYLDMHVFGRRRSGVFVDIGAFDGITGSNTLFFEMFRDWSGLLIEAVEEQVDAACEFRKSECIQALVGSGAPAEFLTIDGGPRMMSGLTESYDATKKAWLNKHPSLSSSLSEQPTVRLGELLLDRDLKKVDLICMDIEGAELTVLESFPFDQVTVTCWCIESGENHKAIAEIMRDRGYAWMDRIGDDDIYVPPELL